GVDALHRGLNDLDTGRARRGVFRLDQRQEGVLDGGQMPRDGSRVALLLHDPTPIRRGHLDPATTNVAPDQGLDQHQYTIRGLSREWCLADRRDRSRPGRHARVTGSCDHRGPITTLVLAVRRSANALGAERSAGRPELRTARVIPRPGRGAHDNAPLPRHWRGAASCPAYSDSTMACARVRTAFQ